ncbi:RibD family protein [Caldiplasma sukawensis]
MDGLHITVNMAQSINGYISLPGGKRAFISSDEDRSRLLSLREDSDVVIIGKRTLINDNPFIHSEKKVPVCVIDPSGDVNENLNIFKTVREVIIGNSKFNDVINVNRAKVRRLNCGSPFNLDILLMNLKEVGYSNILVEGGSETVRGFIEKGLVDKFYLFIGDIMLPDRGVRGLSFKNEIKNVIKTRKFIEGGVLLELYPEKLR